MTLTSIPKLATLAIETTLKKTLIIWRLVSIHPEDLMTHFTMALIHVSRKSGLRENPLNSLQCTASVFHSGNSLHPAK